MQTLIQPVSGRSLAVSPSTPTVPLRILAVGDSTIYGFGDPDGGGWIERLRRHWMQPHTAGHILYNLGVRGDGVKQVSQRLVQEFRHRGELRHRTPDALILSVGMNDSARVGRLTGRNMTPMEEFESALDTLLDQAQALCPVLFVGMPPVDEQKMPFSEILYYTHADQQQYKQATQEACQRRGIPYLDVYEQWLNRGDRWWRSRLSSDGIHPNTEGYVALLGAFMAWEAAQPWLSLA